MKTSLNLKYTETAGSAKIKTRSITDVNPNADKNQILAFSRGILALTTNTYVDTSRIQTINVDTEEIPVTPTTKQTATITAPSTVSHEGQPTISWTSDYTGRAFVNASNNDGLYGVLRSGSPTEIYLSGLKANDTVTIMIPETANYTAATATITLT